MTLDLWLPLWKGLVGKEGMEINECVLKSLCLKRATKKINKQNKKSYFK